MAEQAKLDIIKTDLAMSDIAAKDGFLKALLFYADDSMIISREGKMPFLSKAEAEQSWADKPVIKEISWKPVRAFISQSGDLGFTFGFSRNLGKDTTTYTNYCTIWKKQKDGTWKFLYDGGNNTPIPGNVFIQQ